MEKSDAEVAQLVEHFPEEEGVGGSSPPLSTYTKTHPNKGCVLVYVRKGLESRRRSRGRAGTTQYFWSETNKNIDVICAEPAPHKM